MSEAPRDIAREAVPASPEAQLFVLKIKHADLNMLIAGLEQFLEGARHDISPETIELAGRYGIDLKIEDFGVHKNQIQLCEAALGDAKLLRHDILDEKYAVQAKIRKTEGISEDEEINRNKLKKSYNELKKALLQKSKKLREFLTIESDEFDAMNPAIQKAIPEAIQTLRHITEQLKQQLASVEGELRRKGVKIPEGDTLYPEA